MIIGVDIGGTKTLVGLFDDSGKLADEARFPTAQDQAVFATDLEKTLEQLTHGTTVEAIGIASPGTIQNGSIVWAGGNLGWENFSIAKLVQKWTEGPICHENDANLAALAEARAVAPEGGLVLYITLSTGIGSGIIVDGKLLPALAGSEAGQMKLFDEQGTLRRWEDIASGKSLVQKVGQRAEAIEDEAVWKQYARDICLGLQPTINVLRPHKVVLGGGVGMYADKYRMYVAEMLDEIIASRSYSTPEILAAHYGEKSVIYGCYEHARDHLSD